MSERNLTSDVIAHIAGQVVYPAILFYGDFPSTAVRVWSGLGDLVYGGQTFSGVGEFLDIDTIRETMDNTANGIRIGLSGIDSTLLGMVTTEEFFGRAANVWLAFLTSAGALILDPYLLFTGRMDSDDITDNGKTCNIHINIEHRLIDILRDRTFFYTREGQKKIFPTANDKGLDFVPILQDLELPWGQ